MKFHEVALGTKGLPSEVALALSKTALEITALERSAGERGRVEENARAETQEPESPENSSGTSPISTVPTSGEGESSSSQVSFTIQPSNPRFPWTNSQPLLSFTKRYHLACVEHAVQLLTSPYTKFEEVHPTLSFHLRNVPIELFRKRATTALFQPVTYEVPEELLTQFDLPPMYRTVEGTCSQAVKRTRSRCPETLMVGKTRTMVEIALPGFEGEWLEAPDVQEYVEEKGVVIGSGGEVSLKVGDKMDMATHSLDFQKLVEELASASVCIGLGAGIRRWDVDKALLNAEC